MFMMGCICPTERTVPGRKKIRLGEMGFEPMTLGTEHADVEF